MNKNAGIKSENNNLSSAKSEDYNFEHENQLGKYQNESLTSLAKFVEETPAQISPRLNLSSLQETPNNDFMAFSSYTENVTDAIAVFILSSESKTKSFQEIYDHIKTEINQLRKSDLSKYTGDIKKIVVSCLTSSKRFTKSANGNWTLSILNTENNQNSKLTQKSTLKKKKSIPRRRIAT